MFFFLTPRLPWVFQPGKWLLFLLFTPQRHECNPPNAVLAIVAARLRQLPLPRARLGGECFPHPSISKVCFFWMGKMAKIFEKPSFFWKGIGNYSTLVTTKQKKLPEWSKMPLRSQFTVSKDFSSWSASSKAAASWACANLCCFSALRSAWHFQKQYTEWKLTIDEVYVAYVTDSQKWHPTRPKANLCWGGVWTSLVFPVLHRH